MLDGADGAYLFYVSLRDNGACGLYVWDSSSVEVESIYSYSSSTYGICQYSTSSGNSYGGGSVHQNGENGFYLLASSDTVIGTCNGGNQIFFDSNSGAGLKISTPWTGTQVCGNLIGLCSNGGTWSAFPNGSGGVIVTADGGVSLTNNTDSGNQGPGIYVRGPDGSHETLIQANQIGTDPDGENVIPNSSSGIVLGLAQNVRIAGTIISGNGSAGVSVGNVSEACYDVEIANNKIGLSASSLDLGNGGPGVDIAVGEPLPAGGNADCTENGSVTKDDVPCTASRTFNPPYLSCY